MNSLELLVGTTKDAIGAGYPDSKAANMLNATSDKIDDLIALHNHKEEIKDKEKEQPPDNILSKLIEDMNRENREEGFTVHNEDKTPSDNPYIQPEQSDDDDLEL